MSVRKSSKQLPVKIDPNAWMVTFGDLIMLLLTFFVLLLTMKSMDNKALKEIFKHTAFARGSLEFVETGVGGEVADRHGMGQKIVLIRNSER